MNGPGDEAPPPAYEPSEGGYQPNEKKQGGYDGSRNSPPAYPPGFNDHFYSSDEKHARGMNPDDGQGSSRDMEDRGMFSSNHNNGPGNTGPHMPFMNGPSPGPNGPPGQWGPPGGQYGPPPGQWNGPPQGQYGPPQGNWNGPPQNQYNGPPQGNYGGQNQRPNMGLGGLQHNQGGGQQSGLAGLLTTAGAAGLGGALGGALGGHFGGSHPGGQGGNGGGHSFGGGHGGGFGGGHDFDGSKDKKVLKQEYKLARKEAKVARKEAKHHH